WMSTEGRFAYAERDPGWKEDGAVSEANARLRAALLDHLGRQFSNEPELLAAATPSYPPGAKRMLRDNGAWAEALKEEHVELITAPIAEVTEDGIITEDGGEYPVDVIVYATGFQAADYLAPIKIVGRGGRDLHETWDGDPRAYVSSTVPGFPNMFMVGGPNTSLVVIGSALFMAECSADYALKC